MEEKLSKKVSVLFTKGMDMKLDEICRRTQRSKGSFIRLVLMEWMSKNINH